MSSEAEELKAELEKLGKEMEVVNAGMKKSFEIIDRSLNEACRILGVDYQELERKAQTTQRLKNKL